MLGGYDRHSEGAELAQSGRWPRRSLRLSKLCHGIHDSLDGMETAYCKARVLPFSLSRLKKK